jgi:hypothetical protein
MFWFHNTKTCNKPGKNGSKILRKIKALPFRFCTYTPITAATVVLRLPRSRSWGRLRINSAEGLTPKHLGGVTRMTECLTRRRLSGQQGPGIVPKVIPHGIQFQIAVVDETKRLVHKFAQFVESTIAISRHSQHLREKHLTHWTAAVFSRVRESGADSVGKADSSGYAGVGPIRRSSVVLTRKR